jgi:transposase-like protein
VELQRFHPEAPEWTDDRRKIGAGRAVGETGEADFLRAIAEAVLQLLMEADIEGLIGAGHYERSGERTTWRNGYRDRTRLGALKLRIPTLRQGS